MLVSWLAMLLLFWSRDKHTEEDDWGRVMPSELVLIWRVCFGSQMQVC